MILEDFDIDCGDFKKSIEKCIEEEEALVSKQLICYVHKETDNFIMFGGSSLTITMSGVGSPSQKLYIVNKFYLDKGHVEGLDKGDFVTLLKIDSESKRVKVFYGKIDSIIENDTNKKLEDRDSMKDIDFELAFYPKDFVQLSLKTYCETEFKDYYKIKTKLIHSGK
jgi:hypothetical protein